MEEPALNSLVQDAIVELTRCKYKRSFKKNSSKVQIWCVQTRVHAVLMAVVRAQTITNYANLTKKKMSKTSSDGCL